MLDLNIITKEDFVDALILSEDLSEFYLPNEKVLLSLDFNFEEMKEKFENWFELNSDTL